MKKQDSGQIESSDIIKVSFHLVIMLVLLLYQCAVQKNIRSKYKFRKYNIFIQLNTEQKPWYCKFVDFDKQVVSPQLKNPITIPTRVELCIPKGKFYYSYKGIDVNNTRRSAVLAVLIFCHNNFRTISKLISDMNHSEVIFFIHIDAKSNMNWTLNASNVFMIPRQTVYYAGFTMVTSLLSAYQYILSSPLYSFKYVAYLSGNDYPIIPVSSIIKYLEFNDGIDFYEIFPYKSAHGMRNHESRIWNYHNMDHFFRNDFIKNLSRFFPKRERMFNRACKGPNWSLLTTYTIRKLLKLIDSHNDLLNYFIFSTNPDESAIHTLLVTYFPDLKMRPQPFYFVYGGGGHALNINDRLLANAYNQKKIFVRKITDNQNEHMINKIHIYGLNCTLTKEISQLKFSTEYKNY